MTDSVGGSAQPSETTDDLRSQILARMVEKRRMVREQVEQFPLRKARSTERAAVAVRTEASDPNAGSGARPGSHSSHRPGIPSPVRVGQLAAGAPHPAGRHGAAHATRRRRGGLLQVVIWGLVVLVSVFVVRTFLIASYYIPSESMEPTLHGCSGCEPDLVVVDKVSYHFRSISRGDVVVFNRPPAAPVEDKELIKRVIGLPGDTVSAHGGVVYVDDRPQTEKYVNPACHGTTDFAAVTVPQGQYFMMGDNRCDSFDSRRFGTIPRSSIVGRAFAVIWPTKHLRWL